jgi:aryl-alcohol dehydrogenase-like predicted oxidoreductase
MKKRLLGKTGIAVSEIAFGGVEIGIPYGIGVKNAADMLSETDAIRLLRTAVDSGVIFFDTARLYGKSEEIMGKAFVGMRDQVVMCTKCKHITRQDGSLPPEKELRDIVETSLDESLAALQTDRVDVFMLHQATDHILKDHYIPEIFANLKQKGKIRAAGISTYTCEETKIAIESGTWDVIQLPFNLMDQRQKELFPLAEKKGVGLVIRSVLLKGLLSNRGKNLHPALAAVEKHIKDYDRLLEGVSYPLSTLAVKFVLSFPEVAAALVGIDNFDYLTQSLDAANGDYLNRSALELACKLAFPDPEFINLPHWDKMNWLK